MLTLATVKIEAVSEVDDCNIYVDIDDSGHAYIKQGDDWIWFPSKDSDKVIAALEKIRRGA